MAWEQFLTASGFDRYDRIARISPALLCLLPTFVVILLWLPTVWTLLGSLVSLVVGCGLIYGLVQFVRYQGRRVEKKLGNKVGKAKTAALLSHADPHIPATTKARYHRYLRKHGLEVPDLEQERADPIAASDSYHSAVDWLLEHTRPNTKSSMLHSENITYGFRRNLLGLKLVAILLTLMALAGNTYFICARSDQSQLIAGIIVELFLCGTLSGWLWVINSSFVEDASLAYAQRFLAQCEKAK